MTQRDIASERELEKVCDFLHDSLVATKDIVFDSAANVFRMMA